MTYDPEELRGLLERLRNESCRNGGQGAYAFQARELCGQAAGAIESLLTDLAEAKARVGELGSAVKNILPIGDASMPDKAVFPIYVRMSELRALHRLVAGAQS